MDLWWSWSPASFPQSSENWNRCLAAQGLTKPGFQCLWLETPQPFWHLRQFSVLWHPGFLGAALCGNNRSKGDSEYLGLFCIFSQQIPCWFGNGALVFLLLLLLFLQKPMNHSRTFLIFLLALILLTGILWSTLSWTLQLCLPWPWHPSQFSHVCSLPCWAEGLPLAPQSPVSEVVINALVPTSVSLVRDKRVVHGPCEDQVPVNQVRLLLLMWGGISVFCLAQVMSSQHLQ